MKSDLQIAQAATMRPILEVAERVGIAESELDLYGRHKAKVHLSFDLNRGLPRKILLTDGKAEDELIY